MTREPGHRSLPHTADTIVEAWGPDLPACLSEVGRGLVAEFVEVVDAGGAVERRFRLDAPDVERLVVALLQEIIFVVDAEGVVPVDVRVDTADDRSCSGRMRVVPLEAAVQVGPAPKSVSLSGLEIASTDAGWTCRAVIDI